MEKKPISRFAFFTPRASIALLLCGFAYFIAVGRLPAFLRPDVGATGFRQGAAGLTFAERVSYQRAIEEVYWRHRIWPKDNAGPKPPLDAVVSKAQLERKVEDYLSKSQTLEDYRRRTITAEELQAEIDRMAQHTNRPVVLRELFQALTNDPFVIAECLARPTLEERAIADLNAHHQSVAKILEASHTGPAHLLRTKITRRTYTLPEIPLSTQCTDDTWAATTTVNVPDARWGHTAVWTGSEMILWGGNDAGNTYFNTGGRYDPATDSWIATSTTNSPAARWRHSAVWTGNEMIIWGGGDGMNFLNTGGRYNPTTDSWTAISTASAPTARISLSAVWTGSEMIVWGGRNDVVWMNSGGRYNPSTDSWAPTSTINAPEARWAHTAEWTGSEMIVWGGTNQTVYLNTGGRYNPETDSWMTTNTATAPLGKYAHTAVWTGDEMIVWGGVDSTFNDSNTGGRYNPMNDSWAATSTISAPSPRDSHTAVSTGNQMIIWGGTFCCPGIDFNDGGRYNSDTDDWIATSATNAPHARDSHTAVWTGSEMIIWGGGYFVGSNFIPLNTGGRYCAQSGATATPTPTATPTASATPTATPTARISPTPRARPTPHLRP